MWVLGLQSPRPLTPFWEWQPFKGVWGGRMKIGQGRCRFQLWCTETLPLTFLWGLHSRDTTNHQKQTQTYAGSLCTPGDNLFTHYFHFSHSVWDTHNNKESLRGKKTEPRWKHFFHASHNNVSELLICQEIKIRRWVSTLCSKQTRECSSQPFLKCQALFLLHCSNMLQIEGRRRGCQLKRITQLRMCSDFDMKWKSLYKESHDHNIWPSCSAKLLVTMEYLDRSLSHHRIYHGV